MDVLGYIQTVAGNINQSAGGYTGDGVPAVGTYLNAPRGVVAGTYGSFYFADQDNNRIRYVDPNGIIHTVAGNGTQGYTGDNGKATNAELNLPAAVVMYPPEGASPTLFIADDNNQVIRAVDPGGTIYTVAGNGTPGAGGDHGPATAASFHAPIALAVVNGNLYVADYKNNEVRYLKQIIPVPAVSSGGVVSASAFGKLPAAAPGSWIEIYGSNLAAGTRLWASSDFESGIYAPTSLDGTSVTIGGLSAFVSYVSPGQVNVQVPGTVTAGPQPLVVTTAGGNSPAYSLTINAAEPGLLAPSSFNLSGVQYVVAFNPDGSYVLPTGAIAGLTSHPAKPGDTIVMYGIGFGAVKPSIPTGQLVKQDNTLANPFEVSIGGAQATVQYDGLAPNYVGLYQFNVVIPNVGAGAAVPLTFTLGGASDSQTLNLAVQ